MRHSAPRSVTQPPTGAAAGHTGPLRGFVVYNTGAVNLTIAADSFTIRTAPGGAPSPHFGLRDAGGGPLAPGERTILAGQFLALSVRF